MPLTLQGLHALVPSVEFFLILSNFPGDLNSGGQYLRPYLHGVGDPGLVG